MPGSPPLKGGAWEKEKAGKGGIWREGEAALPRRDTILLVPVMRVSGGESRCRSRVPASPPSSIHGCSALPHLSLHGVAGGERKRQGKGRKKPGVDGTPGRFRGTDCHRPGQPGLGKRNPGKTATGVAPAIVKRRHGIKARRIEGKAKRWWCSSQREGF